MKGMVASVLLVLAIAHLKAEPGHAITCGDVDMALDPCISYLTGQQPKPAEACCGGVRRMKTMAATTADKRFACGCMKTAASHFENLKDEFVSALPGQCGTPLPFPIDLPYDCNKID